MQTIHLTHYRRKQIIATVFRFVDYPLPPLIIGFILGGMLENNLGRALKKYHGLDFIWERPVTLGLLIVAVLFLVIPIVVDWRKRRQLTGGLSGE